MGFYAPLGSASYFHEYGQILEGAPVATEAKLKDLCLRVTNAPLAIPAGVPGSDQGGALVKKGVDKSRAALNYLAAFLLIHEGFKNRLIEDCSSGLFGQKSCKVTQQTISTDLNTYVNRRKTPLKHRFCVYVTENIDFQFKLI